MSQILLLSIVIENLAWVTSKVFLWNPGISSQASAAGVVGFSRWRDRQVGCEGARLADSCPVVRFPKSGGVGDPDQSAGH